MSDYVNICHDGKRPARLDKPHGAWWLTITVPLGRKRRLYVGAATDDRWDVPACRSGLVTSRLLIVKPGLLVTISQRRKVDRPSISIHRWCAHIDVSTDPTTPTPPTTAPREDER